MNPSEKGWLEKFLLFKQKQLLQTDSINTLAIIESAGNSQEFLYQLIRPTGLMYGYPIRFIEDAHPKAEKWSEKDKVKVLLLESYLSCGMYFHYKPDRPIGEAIQNVTQDIHQFYFSHFSRYQRPPVSFFGSQKSPKQQIESILDQRISIRYDWRNFWTSFFHNSLLFFDLIFFEEWMHNPLDQPKQTLKLKRQEMRVKMLEIIAAAAFADGKIDKEERELFNYFLQSANLPAPQKKRASSFLNKGIKLEQINLELLHSWIYKKYFLELAILTTFSNRDISPEEQIFLSRLTDNLHLKSSELDRSLQSVKAFVDTYWTDVHYLQIKQNYRIVSERMLVRMRKVVRINQRRIAKEVQESRELVYLLQQSTRRNLSPEEKEKVRNQLLDILRAIPAFAIFMLPFGSFTLPFLLRILPKHILYPSAFREEDE